MYVRSTLQEKAEFLKERQFWFGRLNIYYGSCFSASLSRHTL